MSTVAQLSYPQSTFGATVSALEMLTEESRRDAFEYVIGLLHKEQGNPFRPKSEAEFLEFIEESVAQGENGQSRNAFDSLSAITDRIDMKRRQGLQA